MENTTNILTQKYYLFLKTINHLHNMGYKFVTNADLEKNLTRNINLWLNLDKQRKVSDTIAFIDGTLSELYKKHYIERVDQGKYRIINNGKDFLYELYDILIEEFCFEFPLINKNLLEEGVYEAIVINKQFDYLAPKYQILTDYDISELALEDYQNSHCLI